MNTVIMTGNLTRDPETRQAGESSVCRMRIAVQRGYKGPDGRAPVDYFDVNAWRALGDNCARYLRKGSKVLVVGELNTRSWDGSDGHKHYATEIVARSVEFLSRAQGEETPPPDESQAPAFEAAGFTRVDNDELPF